jgi:GT2 family glycosyltransferase
MVPFVPKETTVVVLTHIPHSEGYYQERFDVTKLSLASLLQHTDGSHDIMVFDNGSSPEMVEFLTDLKDRQAIQYLLLSQKNIGYGAALNMALSAAPGKYVAYTDDDVFFYPDWLSKHLKVLETFPETALVSGQVVEGDFQHDAAPVVAAKHNIDISEFKIPRKWTERWCRGLMLDADEYLSRETVISLKNYMLQHNGVKAYAGATGYSFVFRRSLLDEMPPFWSDRVIGGEDAEWHRVANAKGYLRLTTSELLTDHIGNVLNDFWINEARRFNIDVSNLSAVNMASMGDGTRPRLAKFRPTRFLLHWTARKLSNYM